MRRRPLLWLFLSVLCFFFAAYFWQLGDQWAAKKSATSPTGTNQLILSSPALNAISSTGAMHLLSQPGGPNLTTATITSPEDPLYYRLNNTTASIGDLSRHPRAILLENALLDTTGNLALSLPEQLQSPGDAGAYIVQSRSALDNSFRQALAQAGATIISYIPNNAYLVRASAAMIQELQAHPQVVAALPYEPYFKLKPALLKLAVEQTPLPEQTDLNVLLFADAREGTVAALEQLGAKLLSEFTSPFGPVVTVRPSAYSLASIAVLPGVQQVELSQTRMPANDLSRKALRVAVDGVATNSYLDLTGTNVLVMVNDTGVDPTHPDLAGRVSTDSNPQFPDAGTDAAGHGTHVAGIIAGDGSQSLTVSNASGSVMPPVDRQFRGKAPGARVFATATLNAGAPEPSDEYLQELAARTNALISNNSWNYRDNAYDLAAASYDAAVRDALPTQSGSQPVLFVFPAGNEGQLNRYFGSANEAGLGGNANRILSPGTAKNVITVGAVEQKRDITNEVVYTVDGQSYTNAVWQPLSDADDQVAGYSSRGNVGVGLEGLTGRLKPDVVAPGSFVVSTTSTNWDQEAYYNPLTREQLTYPAIVSYPGELYTDAIYVPDNAIRLSIIITPTRFSPIPFPNLPIYVSRSGIPTGPGDADFVKNNNRVVMPPDGGTVPAGIPLYFAIDNNTGRNVSFNLTTELLLTNLNGDATLVLSNMNSTLGPSYRYESGTSMAAAGVAGSLALMQEFYQQRAKMTNSPAMMKALLINGARSVGNLYDLSAFSPLNAQGWGMVKLPNSAHASVTNRTATANSMLLFDQSPTNALATGQSHTRKVELAPDAQTLPMRVTLVWTDPPGNPAASLKLVNNLDLVVTNLDTKEVFFGNGIPASKDYNDPWDTNNLPLQDVVNNVENVYLSPNLSTNYSITVLGRAVNVNAVTAQKDNVVQDYALVISSGDGEITNAFKLTDAPVVSRTTPLVTVITNMFQGSPGYSGGLLTGQHVGANTPLLGTNTVSLGTGKGQITTGMTNQWHFYAITNDTTYTNAAFLTFLPPNLAVPRMGVTNETLENASRPEADIDLYVSKDPGLTNLVPAVISAASKSLGSGGTETIVISNATGGVYYIGVKAEDQQAAEYAILGVFSELPFSENQDGNLLVRGFPLNTAIPDGTPRKPEGTFVFGIAVEPIKIHRVIVSNVITHELMGDLVGTLTHTGDYSILNNHTMLGAITNRMFIYDDSDEGNVPFSQKTDGPGSLMDFGSKEGIGQWLLTQIDSAPAHIGTNIQMTIFLEKQLDPTEGITAVLPPGGCRVDYLEVPAEATNLTVSVSVQSGTGPFSVLVCPLDGSSSECAFMLITNAIGGTLSISSTGDPALRPATYSIRMCNLGTDVATLYLLAKLDLNPNVVAVSAPSSTGPVAIKDDAVTYASIFITNHQVISTMDVGLLINHARISDLALTLISPDGTRALLFENRGGTTSSGLGNSLTSDGQPIQGATNVFTLYRTDFDAISAGPYAPGTLVEEWTVQDDIVGIVPDYSVPWLENNVLLLAGGTLSNTVPTIASGNYRLTFEVSHAPFLVDTVGWWPLDGDAFDVFSGLDGLLLGNVQFSTGKVGQAFFGDGQATRMVVPRAPELNVGLERGMTIEGWIHPSNVSNAAPIVQWSESAASTNRGVQLWLTDLSASTTNLVPGAISAALWDTNAEAHYISTAADIITNGGWQHIALSYDPVSTTARIYVNGAPVVTQAFNTNFIPVTTGDLYFGFDPTTFPVGTIFDGGLDEFGLYKRVLSDCEIAAIYTAGDNGKYGTNALTCPVAVQVAIDSSVYLFTNGLNWASGPSWETNTIDFAHGTRTPVSVVFSSLDPNVAVDSISLSTLVTNTLNGSLHFTDNTNLASIPIKFAVPPYQMLNFTNFGTYSDDFEKAAPHAYNPGDTIAGTGNGPGGGDWLVSRGTVTVINNTDLNTPKTNAVVLAGGVIETRLPTTPGRRYRLHYNVRGPGAVSWWSGDLNPLNRRAFDLLGGNDGAFIGNASSQPLGYVTSTFPGRATNTLYFDGPVSGNNAGKVELGDPENLRLTNAFTIEGWILPLLSTNTTSGTEQILFRGDSRQCLDPYFLALERFDDSHSDVRFHLENEDPGACGIDLLTTGGLIARGDTNWQHLTAVFEPGVSATTLEGTNSFTVTTNQMRLYVNGLLVASNYTSVVPFRDLDPAYSAGMSIGNRSRSDHSQPFHGFIDELTVYGRALTIPEIEIVSTNRAGKADLTVPPAQSLAKLAVAIDNSVLDTVYGDNSAWTDYGLIFTAQTTNTLLALRSLLPGTMVEGISMVEVPSELSYRPEQALEIFKGMDAFGEWKLEIWDKRTGATNNFPMLVNWQLDFKIKLVEPPVPLELHHGLPYVGTVPAGGFSSFFVQVPLWAERATNSLLFAADGAGNPLPLGVLYNTNYVNLRPTNALFWPPVTNGTKVLSASSNPALMIGQPYYLTVTNTNSVAVNFALGVWFDILTLNNCEPLSSVVGPAGVPRYFQFDVPNNDAPAGTLPQAVSFWLTGANTNLTVVLSQHLPLPDLSDFDYLSQAPSTNDEVVMLVTNTTPFPIQTNRWYVGVFNSQDTNVSFGVQACYDTNNPTFLPLSIDVPFTAGPGSSFEAPPGPPRWLFFKVQIDAPVEGVLFELYGLSGDADLVLQRDVPPTMAPYLAGSFAPGLTSEQIVLRPTQEVPDLRGTYYLGVYNRETNMVSYTVRASVPNSDGFLVSAQPVNATIVPLSLTNALMTFHAVEGEEYTIQLALSLSSPIVWTTLYKMTATTPLATIEVPIIPGQTGYYRVVQTNDNPVIEQPPLTITLVPGSDKVRIAWSALLVDYRLQYSDDYMKTWIDWDVVTSPPVIEGLERVVYDTIKPNGNRFYRLVKGPVTLPPTITITTTNNQIRIAWSVLLVDYRLQFSDDSMKTWTDWPTPPVVEGAEYVVYDTIKSSGSRFYRLVKGTVAPQPTISITLVPNSDLVRIAWSKQLLGYRLQYSDGDLTVWKDWDRAPITDSTSGLEWETYDKPTSVPRFFRLVTP